MAETTIKKPKLPANEIEAPAARKAAPKSATQEMKEQLTKLPKKASADLSGPKIAAVLIRGREIGIRHDVVRTLDRLRLQRRHICVVYKDTPVVRGMLVKCKDLITYGPITDEMFKQLHEKRGSLKDREGKLLNVFRMHPPRGGYGHKGIKVAYQEGGCLGLRRKGMDEFLNKMM